MVFITDAYQRAGSRFDRMTFASGKASSCSRQKLQEGQSTVAFQPSRKPCQSTGSPSWARFQTAVSSKRWPTSIMW